MWKGKIIEEVSEFKYLDYVLKKNGGDDGQIRELKKKDNIVMRKVCGLGERIFKDDIRRKMLFRYLLMEVIMYGAEICWTKRGAGNITKEICAPLASTPVHRYTI